MKEVKKIIQYFLSFWFVVTLVPGMVSTTNDPYTLALSSIGFATIMFLLPTIMTFFKLKEKNPVGFFLVGFIFTVIYIYILKPGVIGFLYIPPTANFEKLLPFIPDFTEFGIILFISVISVGLATILNLKTKK